MIKSKEVAALTLNKSKTVLTEFSEDENIIKDENEVFENQESDYTEETEETDETEETKETDEKEKDLILGDVPESLRIKLVKLFCVMIFFLISSISLLVAMKPYPLKFLFTSIVLILVFLLMELQDANIIINKKYDTIVGKCLYLQNNRFVKKTKLLFFMSDDNQIYNVQISSKSYDFRPGCTVCVYITNRTIQLNRHGSIAINQPFYVECARASDIMDPEEEEEETGFFSKKD